VLNIVRTERKKSPKKILKKKKKIIHPSPFAKARLLVSSSLLRSAREEPPCDAEQRIELGPALQQVDALPTELRRTLN
jgi:hypothetical protein